MGIFSKTKEKEVLTLAFDIGSASVGGVLFYAEKNKIPKILYSVRRQFPLIEQVDFQKLLSMVVTTLNTITVDVMKSGLGNPERIVCVLSSSWYISQTRTIHLEKNTPFVFNSKIAENLVEKEIAMFEEEYISKYAESGGKFQPLEVKTIKTMLNGYETSNPMGQKIKDLEMTIFVSLGIEQVLNQIRGALNTHFPHTEIKFSTFTMVTFAVVRDMYVHQDNFLLIDIAGEVTDIAMVKNNILRESVSFPMGRNFVIRNLATEFGYTLDEAKSCLSLYKDGHSSEGSLSKIEPAMKKMRIEWLNKFQTSLANLSNDISIPATIFLAVDKEYATFFSDIIKTEQFNQYTLTASKFQIILLDAKALHGSASFKDEVTRDQFLILEAIYINRFLN